MQMNDRGASTAVGYVLTLGITLLLVVALLSVSVSLVEDERSKAVHSELSVLGNRLAAELTTADGMVRAADAPGTVTVRATLPDRVANGQYRLSIDERAATGSFYRYRIVLESDVADTSVAVHLKTGTEVAETTVDGGPVVVTYDDGTDTLEVVA
ncbi:MULTISPECIES: DUF7266 family protein [Haloarcula]|uniref:Flagellin n=1 Tax=Haloarcula pellucida TaxID=1427151 RepID=A0A830GL22_9EURY|nr:MULTISPECIES: hypothetical protein [Halomicroarcula]MBX0348610.1 hypothetical protein [Halomicroarcula pellucida]MDS0278413.1 hypothetical protein [Halomicroarcula sp. S1AR25-4]GGN92597.1 hypothetical protein GCM10009030_17000 [Halomicroarcula pellucida]